MKNTFIASVLSIALAATSFTVTPARADEDVAKIIAGLALLGIIAHSAKKDRRRETAPVTRRGYRHGHGHVGTSPRRIGKVAPRRHVKVAPRDCQRAQWTHRGERIVYGARCLQRNVKARLPQDCLRQARTNSGPRFFYTQRCLRKSGWRA